MNEREAEHVRQNSIMMKQKREDKTGITRRKVMFGSWLGYMLFSFIIN